MKHVITTLMAMLARALATGRQLMKRFTITASKPRASILLKYALKQQA